MSKTNTSLTSRMTASSLLLMVCVVLLATTFFLLLNRLYTQHMIQRTLWGYSIGLTGHLTASGSLELAEKIARQHEVGVLASWHGLTVAFDAAGNLTTAENLTRHDRGIYKITVEEEGQPHVTFFWNLEDQLSGHVPVFLIHLVLLSLVIGGTWQWQRKQLKPLQWLRTGVEAVSSGDFKTRVPVVRNDEIGGVAEAFNHMIERVDKMIHDRERLLGDVSHELRSPLSRIKVALALLPDDSKHQLIGRNVVEMQNLIEVLLERERIGVMTANLNRQPVDLTVMCKQIISSFSDRQPAIRLEAADAVNLEADEALLAMLLRNLLDNALKFSDEDSGPVVVSIEVTEDKTTRLTIADEGKGIPEDQRERVFEPFVKLDPARGHRSGYGLGLNLCQRITEAHGGAMTTHANPRGGTVFRVVLN